MCVLFVLSTWHLLFLSAFSKCVLAMSMVEKTVRQMGHWFVRQAIELSRVYPVCSGDTLPCVVSPCFEEKLCVHNCPSRVGSRHLYGRLSSSIVSVSLYSCVSICVWAVGGSVVVVEPSLLGSVVGVGGLVYSSGSIGPSKLKSSSKSSMQSAACLWYSSSIA